MEQPTVPVICTCGYDGKLTSALCPLHGEHGLSAQVDRLRVTNKKLLAALEETVELLADAGLYSPLKRARAVIEEAKK